MNRYKYLYGYTRPKEVFEYYTGQILKLKIKNDVNRYGWPSRLEIISLKEDEVYSVAATAEPDTNWFQINQNGVHVSRLRERYEQI